MKNNATLLSGNPLADYYYKIKEVLLNRIDPKYHAAVYTGVHEVTYAEPEFTGKYLDICCEIYKLTGEKKALENAKLVKASICKNIRSDGYLGCLQAGMETEKFSVWNQSFTVLGLLSYYKVTDDSTVLATVRKCISYVMETFVSEKADLLNGANYGTQHLAMLYPLCLLYQIQPEREIKNYIFYIIKRIQNSTLNFFEFDSILELRSRKAIENFVILLGIQEYGICFSDLSALSATEKYWSQVNETQIRNTGNGSCGELWILNGNAPAFLDENCRPNENCVAIGWVELSLRLFFLTQKKKYLDAIEKTVYNHILASVHPDGRDFAYYQPNFGKKVRSTEESMYKCCRYRGFTFFSYLPQMLFFENEEVLIPTLYTSCDYESEEICIKERTNYPYQGKIHFSVRVKKGYSKQLRLKIPDWTEDFSILQNKKEIKVSIQNGYADLTLFGENEITLTLKNQLQLQQVDIEGKLHISLTRGAVLLALEDYEGKKVNINNPDFQEETDAVANLCYSCNGFHNGKAARLKLVDYASAGNYTVWIPIQ